MRTFYILVALSFALWHTSYAQPVSYQPDTLIIEPVVGDPLSNMLPIPSGTDDVWINFDQDLIEGYCVENGVTNFGWYIERDFGFLDTSDTDNEAFTSCSYLDSGLRNDNWLILPPVVLPDASFNLCWRSLTFEGPAYTDGYKVLVSTDSNLPSTGDFSHVLFTAAEMIKPLTPEMTLDPNDYLFSPGYIHAHAFTDTNYYFKVLPDGPIRGRLEPHCVSLAGFAGQKIYIAFHHDSQDDNQMQLDDILVSNDLNVGDHQPSPAFDFSMLPNPATSKTFVRWQMDKPEAGNLLLRDLSGHIVLEKHFSAYEQGQFFLELQTVASGVYTCTLQTPSGQATRKLVKM